MNSNLCSTWQDAKARERVAYGQGGKLSDKKAYSKSLLVLEELRDVAKAKIPR